MAQTAKHPISTPLLIDREIEDFLVDRQSRNLSNRTMLWYSHSLKLWRAFAVSENAQSTTDVDAPIVRRFLLHLSNKGFNDGGVHNVFGALRAFLRWYTVEYTPKDWANPLNKVKAPRRSQQPLEPLPLKDFHAMLATCKAKTFTGDRDKAILLFLLDSGIRKQEVSDLNIGDVDTTTGQTLVRQGKGRKPRVVFIGSKTRRALNTYLRYHTDRDNDAPLWTAREGNGSDRLTPSGIREIMRRRAKQAGVKEPGLHEFRRAFAINSWRNGMDIATIQRLLGHTSVTVTMKYLALTVDDMQEVYRKTGPVDNMT